MIALNLGTETNATKNIAMEFDHYAIEKGYRFFMSNDMEEMTSELRKVFYGISNNTYCEIMLDAFTMLSGLRGFRNNMVEYVSRKAMLEKILSEAFNNLPTYVVEGRYIKVVGTKRELVKLAIKFRNGAEQKRDIPNRVAFKRTESI